jgi:hypothetical protein
MVRITLAALLLSFAAAADQPAQGQQRPHQELSPADEKEIHDYDLTQPRIDRMLKVGARMRDYLETHPEEKKENPMAGKNLDDSVARMDQKPEMVAMMKSEGVKPREWLVGMMAFVNAAMWSEASKRNPTMQAPPTVNQKNVEYLRAHPELMQRWMDTWEPQGAKH